MSDTIESLRAELASEKETNEKLSALFVEERQKEARGTWKMAESYSAMAKELAAEKARADAAEAHVAAVSVMASNGAHCYYCGGGCEVFAGNPGRWPIALCHADEPGVMKWHHVSCVVERLADRDRLLAIEREALALVERSEGDAWIAAGKLRRVLDAK